MPRILWCRTVDFTTISGTRENSPFSRTFAFRFVPTLQPGVPLQWRSVPHDVTRHSVDLALTPSDPASRHLEEYLFAVSAEFSVSDRVEGKIGDLEQRGIGSSDNQSELISSGLVWVDCVHDVTSSEIYIVSCI